MLLKLAILSVVVALGAGTAKAGTAEDARELRRLQEKAGEDSLVPVDSSRAQVAVGLADVAATAGQPGSDLSSWTSRDYDALFALLQQYREELAALGLKQAAIDAAMEALRKRVADLEQRMEYLPPDGMKIHGKFSVLWDDLLFTGPGAFSGDPTRYRHFKQHVQLEFTTIHGPFMGMTGVDLVNYVGSYVAPEPLGIRRVFAEMRTPIAMQGGDLYVRFTPLTLWRNEDEDPYVPEPYKGRIGRLREDLMLQDDHSHYLRGFRILTDLMLGESHALELEAFFSTLAGPGQTNYIGADPLTGKDTTDDFVYKAIYTSYLTGWKAEMEVYPGVRVGYFGTKMLEDPNTAYTLYDATMIPSGPYNAELVGRVPVRTWDLQGHSARATGKLFNDMLDLEAEYAVSLYTNPNIAYAPEGQTSTAGTPNYFANTTFRDGGALPGSAVIAKAAVDLKWMKLSASMRQVDEAYVAPAAQTRTLDRNRTPYGPFFTENSLFNPQYNSYGGFTGFPMQDYQETQFNRRILAPSTLYRGHFNFNYLIPSDLGFEAGSPYGLATPNRAGYAAEASFNLMNGFLQPALKVDLSHEIEGQGRKIDEFGADVPDSRRPPINYTMMRGGLIVDLKPRFGWPVKLITGYRMEATHADADWAPELAPSFAYPDGVPAARVAFDSTRLDIGTEYYPVASTGLFAGYRHLDYNGTYYSVDSTNYGTRGQYAVQQYYETYGLGLRHFMGQRIVMDVLYTHQTFPDRNLALTQGLSVAYEIEQIFGKFTVTF
ncbi:MAG: hypothetical protein V4498_09300 [candidate division FCPU426 bacterium]